MNVMRIAIDGASRGNGKEDCVSGSGIVVMLLDPTLVNPPIFVSDSSVEYGSTNQRGEIRALIKALEHCVEWNENEAQIVTDSEYLFNTVTKEWYKGWISRGWLTRDGNPVKNQDLWEAVAELLDKCDTLNRRPMLYHIKGHLIPDGGQRAMSLVRYPEELHALYKDKFDQYVIGNETKIIKAQELSKKNNGFEMPYGIFRDFVALNGVADRIAVQALIDAKN